MNRTPLLPATLLTALIAVPLGGTARAQVGFQDASNKLTFVRAGGPLGGAAVLDYDRDGDLDLFLPNGTGQHALFRNDGKGNFVNVAKAAGVASGIPSSGAIAGDIDNDGWPDIFLSGDGEGAGRRPMTLYRNLGNGTFKDIAKAAGIRGPDTAFSAAFLDIDNDGDLDLFICAFGSLATKKQYKNQLYRNNGNLTFTDISKTAGLDTSLGACAVTTMDYDRDGFTDLVVAVCNDVFFAPTPIHLFHNNGNATFTDVRGKAGLSPGGFWMCAAPGDIDGDGDIDLFASNIGATRNRPQRLYRNDGDGTFTNIAVQAGVAQTEFGWGGTLGDFDNDGDLDLFYTGSLGIGGFNIIGPGRGNPGRLFWGDGKGNNNHWLTVRPVGTRSNRGGVGAFVELFAGGKRQVREVIAGSSVLSSETPWPSFGLGSLKAADVRISWPSGRCELFENLTVDRIVTLTEGSGSAASSYVTFGKTCSAPITLATSGTRGPRIGKLFTVTLKGLPNNRGALMLLGFSRKAWGPFTLPLPMAGLGMPGCELLASPDRVLATVNGTWGLGIPNDARLVGARFYNQGLIVDPTANAAGLTITHGGQAKIGRK